MEKDQEHVDVVELIKPLSDVEAYLFADGA